MIYLNAAQSGLSLSSSLKHFTAMASFVDDIINQNKDYEEFDEEKASRSIVVSNIPPEVPGEQLLIHFQRKRNGGGEIDRICMIEADGNAVIIFDEADVARSVLAKEQILQKSGKKLTVQAFNVARPPEVPEVFHRVSARLNPEIFPSSGYADIHKLLRRIAVETEVEWHEACDGFIISGSFEQLQNAYQQLNRHLHHAALQNPEIQRELSSKGAKVSDNSETENKQNRLNGDEGEDEDKYEEEVVEEMPPFDVEPRFMKYFERVQGENLKDIEESFSVHIEWPSSGEDTKAFIKAMPGCQVKDYNDAYESFIALYQKLHSNMKQEVVANNKDEGAVETAAAIVEDKFPVIISKASDQVLVYGMKEFVHAATKMVRSELGLEQGTLRRKVRKSSGDKEDGQRRRAPNQPLPQILQQVLTNGVRLSVYQEDITNSPVDVIVNAANEGLNHNGGVAKAIQDKGGRQIYDESQMIMFSRSWRPLAVGDVVIAHAGQLQCSAVIHTVGPIWGKQNNDRSILLLHTAVINSLRLAASYRMRSIAFPAISSGSFGMPKELSARAMFDAVEEYCLSVEAKQFPLCDIRFVNIDSPTVDVFKQEFVKRFGMGTQITSDTWQPQVLTAHNNTGVESFPFQVQGQTYSRTGISTMPPPGANQVYGQHRIESVQNFGAQQQNNQPCCLPYGRQDPNMSFNQTQGTFPSHDFMSRIPIEQYGQSCYSNTNVQSPEMNQPHLYYAVGNERSQGDDRRVGQQFDGYEVTSFGVGGQNTHVITSTESSTVNPESANQPHLNTNTNFAGISLQKSKGRGRGFIAARFGAAGNSPPLPGAAVRQTEEVKSGTRYPQGTTPKTPESSKVTTDTTVSYPPPGFPPNYRPEMQTEVRFPATSQLEKKEITREKATFDTDTDETKQSDVDYAEAQKGLPTQEKTKRVNDSERKMVAPGEELAAESTPDANVVTEAVNGDHINSSKASSFALPEAQRTIQSETAKPDLKDLSAETASNKESTLKARKDSEDIREDAKVPPHSPPPAESNEGRSRDNANRSDDKNVSEPDAPSQPADNNKLGGEEGKNIVDQQDVTTDRDASLAGEKKDPNKTSGLKIQGTEPQNNDNHLSSPCRENKDCEVDDNSHNSGEPDHSKDSTPEVHVSSTATPSSPKQENSNLSDQQKSNSNIHCDHAETLEHEPVKGDSTEKTTLISASDEQKERNFNTDDQMPPLSDVSEEDNRAVYPKQDSPSADYTADQPLGYMTWSNDTASLPGYERRGTIIIKYIFPPGVQGAEHPNPGQPYLESNHEIYLPDTAEGREVLGLLKVAFDTRKLFTLKCSNISSQPGQIVWSDIPHKTSRTGGPPLDGYPDASYLEEVKAKLAAHDIVSSPK